MGRMSTSGSGNAMAKLTESMVIAIRRSYARTRNMPMRSKARVTIKYLAFHYGVSQSQIFRIIHKTNWKRVHIKRVKWKNNETIR